MIWPFGSSGHGKDPNDDQVKKKPISWSKLLGPLDSGNLAAAKEWAPVVVISLAGLGVLQLYANYLRRIPDAISVRPEFFNKRSLFGRVTSVGDGDGFHLFHTPGGRAVGWGWLRKIPQNRKDLQSRTVSIRIAGVDAPEGAHFGRPAQPFAAEAMKWLNDYILHRNVRAYVYKKDMYDRIVATVYVRRYFIRRNVGLELVKRGLATVYEAKSGGEYGGLKEVYEKAEAKAKRKRKGMWSIRASAFESPRAYKTRYATSEQTISK